jgi:hypothetical protein
MKFSKFVQEERSGTKWARTIKRIGREGEDIDEAATAMPGSLVDAAPTGFVSATSLAKIS